MIVFLVVFLSPVIAALLTAWFRHKGWIARFIDWLGFKTARRNSTAWDFKMSTTPPVWVNVLLKNGDRILGFFGEASFAGDSHPDGDLYLETTLKINPEREKQIDTPNGGIWIASDQIATIDFIGYPNGER